MTEPPVRRGPLVSPDHSHRGCGVPETLSDPAPATRAGTPGALGLPHPQTVTRGQQFTCTAHVTVLASQRPAAATGAGGTTARGADTGTDAVADSVAFSAADTISASGIWSRNRPDARPDE
jgi:hypothetical protein